MVFYGAPGIALLRKPPLWPKHEVAPLCAFQLISDIQSFMHASFHKCSQVPRPSTVDARDPDMPVGLSSTSAGCPLIRRRESCNQVVPNPDVMNKCHHIISNVKNKLGASLVVQWLRIRLPMQESQV